MANPFLFTEEAGSPQVSGSSVSFNPFLAGNDFQEPSANENPFMSSFGGQLPLNTFDSGNTNPFAFGGDENAESTNTDFFSINSKAEDTSTAINYENIFSSSQKQQIPTTAKEMDIFGSSIAPEDDKVTTQVQQNFMDEDLLASADASSTDIFSSAIPNENIGSENVSKAGPPKRPPPPRPGPPKETKDLILSVTGAMEATSSHLLDRLQATRTPSPTPMRDLHSPSPTQFGDLLEVDEPVAPPPSAVSQEVNFLGDDFDFQTPPVVQPIASEKRASISEKSITPISPVKTVGEMPPPLAPVASIATAAPPTRPTPPAIPGRPKIPPQPARPPAPVVPVAPINTALISQEAQGPQQSEDTSFADVFGDEISNISSNVEPPSTKPLPPHSFTSPFMENSTGQQQQDLFSTEISAEKPQDDIFSAEISTGKPQENIFSSQISTGIPQEDIFSTEISTVKPEDDLFSSEISTGQQHEDLFSAEANVGKLQDDIFSIENENANIISSDTDKLTDSIPFGDRSNELMSESTTFAEAETFGVQPFTDASATFSDLSSSNALHDPEASTTFLPADKTAINADFTQDLDITKITSVPQPTYNIFDSFSPPQTTATNMAAPQPSQDDFDAFAAKFDSVAFGEANIASKPSDPFDPFSTFSGVPGAGDDSSGFGVDDNFDTFLSLREPPPVPQGTPARVSRGESVDSTDENEFNIFIKPKDAAQKTEILDNGPMPALAPPPKSPSQGNALQDTSPRFNPFDSTQEIPSAATENIFAQAVPPSDDRQITRTDSQETPPTPLFDEDVSQPLEDFPRIHYEGPGWEMQLRQPNKKKITGQRFWKKIFIKLVMQGENPVLQLFNGKDDKDPFQELPLQPCYSVSEIGAQQYDQYGKIFTVKLQFIYYKERPGVRPGQVTKAERITNKLSQFAAYAIQGDYQGVKEFGSDLKKLGLPVEHAPQISQLFKIGSQSYEDMKQFSMCIEEALFRLSAHRDRALNYKMEEVQITAVDELYVEQNANGGVEKQIARVRLFFLGFLSGMPDVELGVNDLVRQGKEVVGRHDIIPVVTEEWIRLENVEFHSCVQQDEYEKTRTIKFKPPDACYIELMRFRIRPPKNRELPLQLKATICVTGNKVEIHGDILVPGFTSRKLGQIPCEDVMVRIPIPECWIYQFRVEKHFRYGSVKSAHRRTGKVKGIERFLGAIENMEPSLMEVTSGQAKYEHQHRAIVWRMPRLPKEGQGAYTTHNLVVRLQLTSYDQIPEELAKYCYLEFTMPATTVSHTTVRSVSIADSDSDAPPEKYVRQLARHEYRVEIEHSQGEGPSDYIAATVAKHPPPAAVPEEQPPTKPAATSDSDSDSG